MLIFESITHALVVLALALLLDSLLGSYRYEYSSSSVTRWLVAHLAGIARWCFRWWPVGGGLLASIVGIIAGAFFAVEIIYLARLFGRVPQFIAEGMLVFASLSFYSVISTAVIAARAMEGKSGVSLEQISVWLSDRPRPMYSQRRTEYIVAQLGERLVDSVAAPLIYFVIGGPIAALPYALITQLRHHVEARAYAPSFIAVVVWVHNLLSAPAVVITKLCVRAAAFLQHRSGQTVRALRYREHNGEVAAIMQQSFMRSIHTIAVPAPAHGAHGVLLLGNETDGRSDEIRTAIVYVYMAGGLMLLLAVGVLLVSAVLGDYPAIYHLIM